MILETLWRSRFVLVTAVRRGAGLRFFQREENSDGLDSVCCYPSLRGVGRVGLGVHTVTVMTSVGDFDTGHG